MPPKKRTGFWSPSSQQKNFQAAAAFVSLELLYEQGQMTKADQELFLYEHYHGNATKDIIGQVDMLLNGEGVYSGLFETALGSASSRTFLPI